MCCIVATLARPQQARSSRHKRCRTRSHCHAVRGARQPALTRKHYVSSISAAPTRPDPAHYVSSLHPSHGEEWNEIFANKVSQRYQVPREALDGVCNESVSKAAELAKLF